MGWCAVSARAGSVTTTAPVRAAAEVRWAAYYAAAAALSEYDRFDLLILDSDDHAPLGPLLSRGKTLLGYISLGEIGRHRAYFGAVQREGLLLQESEHWKGSFFVVTPPRRRQHLRVMRRRLLGGRSVLELQLPVASQ